MGSLNLYNFVKNPFTDKAKFDFSSFSKAVQNAVVALDMILDYGYDTQPLEANRKCIDDWRSIGLGVFGLADMLVAMNIKYGSIESLELIDKVMATMQDHAYIASARRGKEIVSFGKFKSKYFYASKMVGNIRNRLSSGVDADLYGYMRNGTLLAIAPTGSISMLFRESGGVEPYYNISYERTTHVLEKQGKSFHISMLAVEHLLKSKGLNPDDYSSEAIKEMFPYVVNTYDVDPYDRVKVQSTMQEYVDNAISSTINLKEDVSVKDIFDLYIEAHKQGCKGITIFRDNCKRVNIMGTDHGVKREDVNKPETVSEIPKDVEVVKVYSKAEKLNSLEPHKRNGIKSLWGRTFVFHTSCVPKFYVTVNVKDNDIFEVFVGVDRGCQANIATITRLTSYALRLGGKVDDIVDELNSAVCPACTAARQKGDLTVNKSCASCIADAIKEMQKTLNGGKKDEDLKNEIEPVEEAKSMPIGRLNMVTPKQTGLMECPECHQKTIVPDGHCIACQNCGYTKCS